MKKRANINDIVNNTIKQFPTLKYKCLLQERLDERGLNLRELSLLTGIRYATLHEFKTSKKASVNMQHTMAIMVALRLTTFDQLFTLCFEDQIEEERFITEAVAYEQHGIPDDEIAKIKENAEVLGRTDELRKQ